MGTIELLGAASLPILMLWYVFGINVKNRRNRERLPIVSASDFIEQMRGFGLFSQEELLAEREYVARTIRFPVELLSANLSFEDLEANYLGRFQGVRYEAMEDRLSALAEKALKDVPESDCVGQYIANVIQLQAALRES